MKKKMKFKNFLESLDQFKIEHNFQYTKKEAKGSLTGCFCTFLFNLLMFSYLYDRLHLFWTHDEDSYNSYKLVVDFEELGIVDMRKLDFSTGILLDSTDPQYKNVMESEDEIFQYINIYSAQAKFGKKAVIGG